LCFVWTRAERQRSKRRDINSLTRELFNQITETFAGGARRGGVEAAKSSNSIAVRQR